MEVSLLFYQEEVFRIKTGGLRWSYSRDFLAWEQAELSILSNSVLVLQLLSYKKGKIKVSFYTI